MLFIVMRGDFSNSVIVTKLYILYSDHRKSYMYTNKAYSQLTTETSGWMNRDESEASYNAYMYASKYR